MQTPSKKPDKQRQSQPGNAPASSGRGIPPGVVLAALLGIGAMAILPRLVRTQSPSATGSTVVLNEDAEKIHAFWGPEVSQQQFYFDNLPAAADCDRHSCAVLKRPAAQIYFRWFNDAENRWYYFQCPSNYRGQFQGIPYTGESK